MPVLFPKFGSFPVGIFFNVDTADETRAINENTAVSKLVISDESIRQLEYRNDYAHVPGLETTL